MENNYCINLNAPFELGESKEIRLNVFLPKDSNQHLGDSDKIALVMAGRLNKLYADLVKRPHWETDPLWFKPICKND